jgi:hypothetical protein
MPTKGFIKAWMSWRYQAGASYFVLSIALQAPLGFSAADALQSGFQLSEEITFGSDGGFDQAFRRPRHSHVNFSGMDFGARQYIERVLQGPD